MREIKSKKEVQEYARNAIIMVVINDVAPTPIKVDEKWIGYSSRKEGRIIVFYNEPNTEGEAFYVPWRIGFPIHIGDYGYKEVYGTECNRVYKKESA